MGQLVFCWQEEAEMVSIVNQTGSSVTEEQASRHVYEGDLGQVHWKEKTQPTCGQHHFVSWGPGLSKMEKVS